jgi:hypothetical protein
MDDGRSQQATWLAMNKAAFAVAFNSNGDTALTTM